MNVASRLEGANKVYGTQILIGEATERLARDGIVTREVDSFAVYGRDEGLSVYELVGQAGETIAERQRVSWIERYEGGLAKYRSRNFSGAVLDFEAVLRERDRDRPTEVLLDRCKELDRLGESEEWEPTAALRSK